MKWIGSVAALAAIGAAAIALGGGSQAAGAAGERTIPLTLVKAFFHPVDQGRKGESSGDYQVFGGRLVSDGRTRGLMQAHCVVVSRSNQECTFSYSLDGGQIASVVGYGKGFSGNRTSTDPIVGGTGPYEGVRGEITGTEVGPRTDQLTFHLLD